MNDDDKKRLGTLIETLQGIHDGKPWEWAGSSSGEYWYMPSGYLSPELAIMNGYRIRLKPAPDPYAELKAAHAVGKVIQNLFCDNWYDCHYPAPTFSEPPEYYRIKPDPVQLEPEDVPPGSVLRLDEWNRGQHVTPSVFLGVVCWINTTGPVYLTYDELMRGGWQILRPGQDWQPCSKPAP